MNKCKQSMYAVRIVIGLIGGTWCVYTATDMYSELLSAQVSEGVNRASKRKIEQVKRRTQGGKFVARKEQTAQQEASLAEFIKMIGLISKDGSIKSKQIEKLNDADLQALLTATAHFFVDFPPLPGHEESWAAAITSFLTFNDVEQKYFEAQMLRWIDLLSARTEWHVLVNADQDTARATAQAVRKAFRKAQSKSAALLYAWVQAASTLSSVSKERSPLTVFIELATNDSSKVLQALDPLLEKIKTVMEQRVDASKAKKKRAVTDKDAQGFFVLLITTLCTPDSYFDQQG